MSQAEIDHILKDKKRPEHDAIGKQIAASRRVDFKWFTTNKLDVGPLFEKLGMKVCCESFVEISMKIIREFYMNLIFKNEYSVSKFLKNHSWRTDTNLIHT